MVFVQIDQYGKFNAKTIIVLAQLNEPAADNSWSLCFQNRKTGPIGWGKDKICFQNLVWSLLIESIEET